MQRQSGDPAENWKKATAQLEGAIAGLSPDKDPVGGPHGNQLATAWTYEPAGDFLLRSNVQSPIRQRRSPRSMPTARRGAPSRAFIQTCIDISEAYLLRREALQARNRAAVRDYAERGVQAVNDELSGELRARGFLGGARLQQPDRDQQAQLKRALDDFRQAGRQMFDWHELPSLASTVGP